MNIYKLMLVGIGGFAGSILRYITVSSFQRFNFSFPLGTFIVNIAGSFILGTVVGWMVQRGENDSIRLLLITGVCGGFTTFSAFAFENVNLFEQKLAITSIAYIVGSIVLGIGAVIAGIWIGRNI
jgi:fluoride exporter